MKEFRAFAKKNVLFAVLKYKGADDGTVDLITNVDYAAQVNLFMETQRISCPGTGASPSKKRRPPRSARVLLTTAREWLDSLPDEADEADDEDY